MPPIQFQIRSARAGFAPQARRQDVSSGFQNLGRGVSQFAQMFKQGLTTDAIKHRARFKTALAEKEQEIDRNEPDPMKRLQLKQEAQFKELDKFSAQANKAGFGDIFLPMADRILANRTDETIAQSARDEKEFATSNLNVAVDDFQETLNAGASAGSITVDPETGVSQLEMPLEAIREVHSVGDIVTLAGQRAASAIGPEGTVKLTNRINNGVLDAYASSLSAKSSGLSLKQSIDGIQRIQKAIQTPSGVRMVFVDATDQDRALLLQRALVHENNETQLKNMAELEGKKAQKDLANNTINSLYEAYATNDFLTNVDGMRKLVQESIPNMRPEDKPRVWKAFNSLKKAASDPTNTGDPIKTLLIEQDIRDRTGSVTKDDIIAGVRRNDISFNDGKRLMGLITTEGDKIDTIADRVRKETANDLTDILNQDSVLEKIGGSIAGKFVGTFKQDARTAVDQLTDAQRSDPNQVRAAVYGAAEQNIATLIFATGSALSRSQQNALLEVSNSLFRDTKTDPQTARHALVTQTIEGRRLNALERGKLDFGLRIIDSIETFRNRAKLGLASTSAVNTIGVNEAVDELERQKEQAVLGTPGQPVTRLQRAEKKTRRVVEGVQQLNQTLQSIRQKNQDEQANVLRGAP